LFGLSALQFVNIFSETDAMFSPDSLAHTTSATLTIVKTWSQRYHQNSDTAFLELLNFLIQVSPGVSQPNRFPMEILSHAHFSQSSGCTTRISSEQLDGSREEIVATLLSEEDEVRH